MSGGRADGRTEVLRGSCDCQAIAITLPRPALAHALKPNMRGNKALERETHDTQAAGAGSDTDLNRLALRVHLRLASCRNLLMRECRKKVERWNLTLPQFDVLAELARATEGGFTFIELSRLLLVTSGNLTGIVDRLEQEGLVWREPDGEDRRVIRVRLTPKGRKLTERMLPQHADDVNAILSGLAPETLAQLADLLGELRDYLHGRSGDRVQGIEFRG
jgi:DNA-binding MarR family transcriptional regulator